MEEVSHLIGWPVGVRHGVSSWVINRNRDDLQYGVEETGLRPGTFPACPPLQRAAVQLSIY